MPLLMLIGAAIGAVNGFLVAVLRYQPVIATLCTFFVLAGVIAKISPATPSTRPAGNWTASTWPTRSGPSPARCC